MKGEIDTWSWVIIEICKNKDLVLSWMAEVFYKYNVGYISKNKIIWVIE